MSTSSSSSLRVSWPRGGCHGDGSHLRLWLPEAWWRSPWFQRVLNPDPGFTSHQQAPCGWPAGGVVWWTQRSGQQFHSCLKCAILWIHQSHPEDTCSCQEGKEGCKWYHCGKEWCERVDAGHLEVKAPWLSLGLPGVTDSKESAAMHALSLQKDPLEEGLATHSSILAWRIPGTEEPAKLQSVGSQMTWLSSSIK